MVIVTSLHRFLFEATEKQRILFRGYIVLVPSAEIGKSSIGGKWRSLSVGVERSNLRPEVRSPEWSKLKNNFEVKPYIFISVCRVNQ